MEFPKLLLNTKEELVELVRVELENIRNKSTSEELERLDIEKFFHSSTVNCIYGQLTGFSLSVRAKEIQPKQVQYFPENSEFDKLDFEVGSRLTVLENYLRLVNSEKHALIFEYLKNKEITTIDLSF